MTKSVLACDVDYRSEMIGALTAFDERVRAPRTAAAWTAATPCEGWSAADVVTHVTGNVRTFVTVAGGDPPADEQSRTAGAADRTADGLEDPLIAEWERACATADHFLRTCGDPTAVRVPLGPREMTIAFAIEALLRDVVIHTWDLARATGGDESLPSHLVTAATASLARLPQRIRERGYYSDALEVSPDATDQVRLIALAGRRT
jgi:uncharacterized protein (TIGR03086 family)